MHIVNICHMNLSYSKLSDYVLRHVSQVSLAVQFRRAQIAHYRNKKRCDFSGFSALLVVKNGTRIREHFP